MTHTVDNVAVFLVHGQSTQVHVDQKVQHSQQPAMFQSSRKTTCIVHNNSACRGVVTGIQMGFGQVYTSATDNNTTQQEAPVVSLMLLVRDKINGSKKHTPLNTLLWSFFTSVTLPASSKNDFHSLSFKGSRRVTAGNSPRSSYCFKIQCKS